jgi:hypothetical protein
MPEFLPNPQWLNRQDFHFRQSVCSLPISRIESKNFIADKYTSKIVVRRGISNLYSTTKRCYPGMFGGLSKSKFQFSLNDKKKQENYCSG